jgi:hypothetical protein
VVAQTLDYGSWVKDLSYEQVKAIYEQGAGQHEPAVRFEQAFARRFGVGPPETLNEAHNLIVVVSELDPSTERIISYLAEEFGVPINAVLFQHFQDGGHHYLTRTWLRDPRIAEAQTPKGKRETWNGVDFYVSFGDGEHRSWEDARRYHFVSGGQGSWYSKTLKMLTLHSRIFVHIPGQGYVGVGTVIDLAVPINEFMVDVDGRHVPILSAPGLKAHRMEANKDDPERSEWLVRVQWIDARPREQAYWETGMFANQNTACRLRNKFTLEKLRAHFRLED